MTNAVQKRNGANAKELILADGIFNHTLRRFFDGNLWDADGFGNRAAVPVNVRETDQQYEVDVIAPGRERSAFSVKVQQNELVISCTEDEEKKQAAESTGWVRTEYQLQSFERRFTLDDTVDPDNISAAYADGILRITLPKTDKAKPRLLSIEVK